VRRLYSKHYTQQGRARRGGRQGRSDITASADRFFTGSATLATEYRLERMSIAGILEAGPHRVTGTSAIGA